MQPLHVLLIGLALAVAGWVHPAQGQRLKAFALSRDDSAQLHRYQQQLEASQTDGQEKSQAEWLNQIARLYWDHNHFEAAARHYQQSLAINKRLGNENGMAMINSNLGFIYADLGQYEQAKTHLEETLAARRAKKEKPGMISALINISVVLNNLQRYTQSIDYLDEALTLALETNDPAQMKSCYGMLSETWDKAGNPQKAFHYFQLYKTFHEYVQQEKIGQVRHQLDNERLRAQMAEMEKRTKELEIRAQNQVIQEQDSTNQRLTQTLTRKEMALRLAHQEAKIHALQTEKAEQEAQAAQRRQRTGLLLLLAAAALLFVAYWVNRRLRRTKNQLLERNHLIGQQQKAIVEQHQELQRTAALLAHSHQEITASIHYAAIIQSATLFQQERLSDLIPDSFIFFQPKAVVSGDFYWYRQVGQRLFVAAVDCTGHGVPGGFMSMIASNLLSETILTRQLYDPAQILQHIDQGIQNALNQCLSSNKDGMDIALCVVDRAKGQLYYAGAKNPLLLVHPQQTELLRATRRSLGGCYKMQLPAFETQQRPLVPGTMAYVYSDGFQDQFGGDMNQKYGNKPFREFLATLAPIPASEQHRRLFDELETWRHTNTQIDDILVIGFRC